MNHNYEINATLTGISLAYKNPSYIADKIFKRVPVTSETFKYRKYAAGTGLTIPKTLIGETGEPNKVTVKGRLQTEAVEAHSLIDDIPQAEIKAAQKAGEDITRTRTMFLTETMSAAREARLATLLSTTSNYGKNTKTLSKDEKISNSDMDALELIEDTRSSMPVKPNTMILNESVCSKLRRNASIIKGVYKNSGDKGIISVEDLKELFRLDNIYIGESRVNVAKKNEDANLQLTWGDDIILCYINPLATVTEGLTFGITAEYEKRTISTFFNPRPGVEGVTSVKIAEQLKDLILAPECGYLIKEAI